MIDSVKSGRHGWNGTIEQRAPAPTGTEERQTIMMRYIDGHRARACMNFIEPRDFPYRRNRRVPTRQAEPMTMQRLQPMSCERRRRAEGQGGERAAAQG